LGVRGQREGEPVREGAWDTRRAGRRVPLPGVATSGVERLRLLHRLLDLLLLVAAAPTPVVSHRETRGDIARLRRPGRGVGLLPAEVDLVVPVRTLLSHEGERALARRELVVVGPLGRLRHHATLRSSRADFIRKTESR